MGSNTIRIDTKQIERLTVQLKGFEKEVSIAAYHALNRTVDFTVVQVARIVPKEYSIKSSEVKESLKRKKPEKSDLTASVTSTGHTLSFAHFPFTPKTAKRSKRSIFDTAVVVSIIKPKGKIMSKKGFVASTGAKSEEKTQFNVFKRTGKFSITQKGRYRGRFREEIAPIRTLSIPQMITNSGVADKIMDAAQKKLEERLDHEITRAMTELQTKIGGK